MKTFRFLYTMHVDIKAKDIDEAMYQFEEADLDPSEKAKRNFQACGFRDLAEVFIVDENGVRVEEVK